MHFNVYLLANQRKIIFEENLANGNIFLDFYKII